MNEKEQYIQQLEEALRLALATIDSCFLVIDAKDSVIFWLIIMLIAQPTIILIVSFWSVILDYYQAYTDKKGGNNG